MGFKNMDCEISFADLILKDSMNKNYCLKKLSLLFTTKGRLHTLFYGPVFDSDNFALKNAMQSKN
jgi:hypothetical protein